MGIFDKALGYEYGRNDSNKVINQYSKHTEDLIIQVKKLQAVNAKQQDLLKRVVAQMKEKDQLIESLRYELGKTTNSKEIESLQAQLDDMVESVKIYKDLYQKEKAKNK